MPCVKSDKGVTRLRLKYKEIDNIFASVLCILWGLGFPCVYKHFSRKSPDTLGPNLADMFLPLIYAWSFISIGYGFFLIYSLIKERLKLGKWEKRD